MESHKNIFIAPAAVTLYVRVPRGTKRAYYPAVFVNPSRIRERCGLVGGKPEFFESVTYALRFRDPVKGRCWMAVGQEPDAALVAKRHKELELEGIALGIPVAPLPPVERRSTATLTSERFNIGPQKTSTTGRLSICSALDSFLDDAARRNSPRTDMAYRNHLRTFLNSLPSTPPTLYMDELTREDVLHLIDYSREQGHSARTTHNAWRTLRTFLRSQDLGHLIKRGDAPRYTKKAPAAYSVNDLHRLFSACSPDDRLLFEFFLGSGAREGEVTYAAWSDINFDAGLFTIRAKPDLGWTLKDREERSVPLPDQLLDRLKERRSQHMDQRFLFPTATGKPNGHYLRTFKTAALSAGLNCGLCVNKAGQSCSSKPVCRHWHLHALRKTFAFLHHDSGVSARTLMSWLGHADLQTTLHYLAVADVRSKRTRSQVNRSFSMFEEGCTVKC